MVRYGPLFGTMTMLKIGKLTDYAMLIMSELAKTPEVTLSATFLAEALHLTSPTVSKVLKMLSEGDLVESVRGAEGGYYLARAARQITLIDIITAMEGELAMMDCCQRNRRCAIESLCTMRENWQRINKIVQTMLAKLTIVDMLEPMSMKHLLSAASSDKMT